MAPGFRSAVRAENGEEHEDHHIGDGPPFHEGHKTMPSLQVILQIHGVHVTAALMEDFLVRFAHYLPQWIGGFQTGPDYSKGFSPGNRDNPA
jgi:hypothetical protein